MSREQAMREAQEQYAVALDALHHQRLVLHQLQELLEIQTIQVGVSLDRGTQTDSEENDGRIPPTTLLRTASLRAQILRYSQRRRAFERAAAKEVDELSLSVAALRLEAADVAPPDVVVHSILQR